MKKITEDLRTYFSMIEMLNKSRISTLSNRLSFDDCASQEKNTSVRKHHAFDFLETIGQLKIGGNHFAILSTNNSLAFETC